MESAMSPYRVLDLTEAGYLICGKILADLGADTIKIERPSGSDTRNLGPFYSDVSNPDRSLYWFAYNTNKRGITLNVDTADGRELFKQLVKTADFVIESFSPGYLDDLGLGYKVLSEINPRLILTSITPYGQHGPYAHWAASELVLWSMGGYLLLNGDPDRPPVWCSFPQAYLNAGIEAAAASMIAHWYRELTGEGQHVDVSVQEAVLWYCGVATPYWDLNQTVLSRAGSRWPTPTANLRMVYQCKDGHVAYQVWGGSDVSQVTSTMALVSWMDEESMAPQWLKDFDWTRDYDASKVTQDQVDQVEAHFAQFLRTKTKKELFDQAQKRNIILAPLNNSNDLLEYEQLASRDFWVKIEHPELKDTLTYCGPFIKLSETPCRIQHRAPSLGEHNEEVYIRELGLSPDELVMLKGAGCI